MDHKLVIRHLSGSKVNQSNEFPLEQFKTLSFGRDEGVDIQYNPETDDLVSRRHAVIQREDGDRFSIKDEASRNGTFVNKQRISGAFALSHGDIVQFGPGGPEFRFELDPPPKSPPPPTREASLYRRSKPTREASSASSFSDGGDINSSSRYRQKGRFTVLQDSLNAYREKSLRTQISISAGLLGLLILVAGLSYYLITRSEYKTEDMLAKVSETHQTEMHGLGEKVGEIEKETTSLWSPQEIAAKYSRAVVLIELDWKLTHRETNKQVYHRRLAGEFPRYLQIGEKIIPWLMIDDENGTNVPIGGSGRGTGFSVSNYGSILTNRHVAASATSTWDEAYMYTKSYVYPVKDIGDSKASIYKVDMSRRQEVDGQRLIEMLGNLNWVPSRDNVLTVKRRTKSGFWFKVIQRDNQFVSRDTLNVYFPGDPNPMPGRLARKSIKHDVALITVDSPGVLPHVPLEDSATEPALGELVTILGYPSVSMDVVGVTKTSNPFDSGLTLSPFYNPTLTTGHMGKRITPNIRLSDPATTAVSPIWDAYQLTANATGKGNSGGPVFNSKGRVTGIFFAGREHGGAAVTYAIPIKYGRDLIVGYRPLVD